MGNPHRSVFSACLFAGALLLTLPASAAPARFSIDATQTQLALSGTLAYAGSSGIISTQRPGSLATFYNGSLNTDLSGSALRFPGGSGIAAQNNGVWQPEPGGNNGAGLADYGGKVTTSLNTVYIALRNILFDVTSGALLLTNGSFPSTNLVFVFPTNAPGSIDYNDFVGGHGSYALTSAATNNTSASSSLTTTGLVQTLTIPVSVSYVINSGVFNGSTLYFNGTIIAQRVIQPLITSIVVSNHIATIKVTNTTAQAQLQISTNLTIWSGASATASNLSGGTIFQTPASAPSAFFRVQD